MSYGDSEGRVQHEMAFILGNFSRKLITSPEKRKIHWCLVHVGSTAYLGSIPKTTMIVCSRASNFGIISSQDNLLRRRSVGAYNQQ